MLNAFTLFFFALLHLPRTANNSGADRTATLRTTNHENLHWEIDVRYYRRLLPLRKLILLVLLVLFCCVHTAQAASLMERQAAIEPLFDAPCAKYDVPKALALAIARQESGCHPYILNVAGKDVRPRTKDEAVRIARAAMRAGRSVDIGIMQINSFWLRKYGWKVEQVLEPRNNVKVGVWILAQEIRRHGLSWRAVAYYHTPLHRNPERGRAYSQSIVRHVRNILAER